MLFMIDKVLMIIHMTFSFHENILTTPELSWVSTRAKRISDKHHAEYSTLLFNSRSIRASVQSWSSIGLRTAFAVSNWSFVLLVSLTNVFEWFRESRPGVAFILFTPVYYAFRFLPLRVHRSRGCCEGLPWRSISPSDHTDTTVEAAFVSSSKRVVISKIEALRWMDIWYINYYLNNSSEWPYKLICNGKSQQGDARDNLNQSWGKPGSWLLVAQYFYSSSSTVHYLTHLAQNTLSLRSLARNNTCRSTLSSLNTALPPHTTPVPSWKSSRTSFPSRTRMDAWSWRIGLG